MAPTSIGGPNPGRINQRILSKEGTRDHLLDVEAARRKIPASFRSPEVKRLYLRFFDSMQLNAHYISVIARTRLPDEIVEQVEMTLRNQIEKLSAEVDKAIDGSDILFKANGILSVAEYETEPLELDVRVVCAIGRRYLELINKVDLLMPRLETLAIDEIISQRELAVRKSLFKRSISRVAAATRNLAAGLRKRANELARQEGPKPLNDARTKVDDSCPDDQDDATATAAEDKRAATRSVNSL